MTDYLKSIPKSKLILNSLIVFFPITLILEFTHTPKTILFVLSCLAIIPLAGFMGEATEKLSATLGSGIGGFLNATFGNAAELIIALIALFAGHTEVVKASLTGSIIGNVLLVLGLSIFVGGYNRKKQVFNSTAASMWATLLILSAIALIIPSVFHYLSKNKMVEAELSLEISIILFLVYIGSLVFSLKTHSDIYKGEIEEEHINGSISRKREILILIGATIGIALMSEVLVGSIEETAKRFGLTDVFIGVILLAIVGNAAEHSTAILMAKKNKLELALNIATGSSVQVALFLAPVLVFFGAITGIPMNLVFTPFEVLSIVASVSIVTVVSMDGETNWMEGLLLIAVYFIIALAFFHLP